MIFFTDSCIPPFAKAQYEQAQQDWWWNAEAAREHSLLALKVALSDGDAWNNLGTLASQTGESEDAERYFRGALKHKADSYSPRRIPVARCRC